MYRPNDNRNDHTPWNKGKIIGQKAPLKLKDVWAIRTRLEMANRLRDLALLNLAIVSKLRACDLVKLKLADVCHGGQIDRRSIILQQKTQRPVQFEVTDQTRDSVSRWGRHAGLDADDFLFRSRIRLSDHITTKQYARIVDSWVTDIGLDPAAYGRHSLRRTKASMIYRRTKNLRAEQILLGHTKLDSSVPGDRSG